MKKVGLFLSVIFLGITLSAHAAPAPFSKYANRPDSFADLAESAGRAVVNISTKKNGRAAMRRGPSSPFGGGHDPFNDLFERFFEDMPQRPQQSLGSGFIIDKNGTILTNSHVIAGADEIEVQLSDGRKFSAEVLGQDERTDLAVIKVKAKKDLPAAKLGNSDKIRPGDWVMAIGNPFGLEQTVTVGVVSATGRLIGGGHAKYIQTDASINPGNSGGPLFNMKGQVVGINSMIIASGQGLGFAIPVNLAKKLAPQLVKEGRVSRGWLGVSIQEITPELAKSFELEKSEGALIAEVFSGSPAAKAGLKRGDIVIEFDGQKVKEPYDLTVAVGNTSPKVKSDLVILRKGKKKTLSVKIGAYQEDVPRFARGKTSDPGKADELGLVVRSISPRDAKRLGVPAKFKGVVIERVEPGSAAEDADMRPGDVLLEINSTKIKRISDYKRISSELKKGTVVRVFVKRGRASVYLAFRF